mgnify:FL=1
MRFNQGEEFFIELGSPIVVPHLPIHHDVREPVPNAPYIHAIRDVIKQLSESLPEAFRGLTYFFDPAEILKPCFYRMFKVDESVYLYLLRMDLLPKTLEVDVLEAGTNDKTPAYASRRLYMDSELIPLDAVMWESGRVRAFKIRQLISQTWIGETGKGYMVRGIWMDSDLSKFFTRLFLEPGKRLYPYHPLFCKYKTVCACAPILSSEARRSMVPLLHYAISRLNPEIENIQNVLRTASFSESLEEFAKLRATIPDAWKALLNKFAVREIGRASCRERV